MVTACDGKYDFIWQGHVDPYTRNVTWAPDDLLEITSVINSYAQICFHGTNFDRRALSTIGIYTDHLIPRMEDTLVLSHVLCNGDVHGLKDLAIKYLRFYDDDEQNLTNAVVSERTRLRGSDVQIAALSHPHFPAAPKNSTWHKQDMWLAPEMCAQYAIKDTQRTWLIWETFKQAFFNDGFHTPEFSWPDLTYTPFNANQPTSSPLSHTSQTNLLAQYRFRMSLLPVLYDMQSYGIHIYLNKIDRLISHLTFQLEGLVLLIKQHSGWEGHLNPDSPKHLIRLLHGYLQLPEINTTATGQPATDKDTLKLLFDEHPDCIALQYLRAWSETQTELTFIRSYKLWAS